jgi:hypothetical protein
MRGGSVDERFLCSRLECSNGASDSLIQMKASGVPNYPAESRGSKSVNPDSELCASRAPLIWGSDSGMTHGYSIHAKLRSEPSGDQERTRVRSARRPRIHSSIEVEAQHPFLPVTAE